MIGKIDAAQKMKKQLSKVDIVIYALYKLGGATKKTHTEKIAWEAYKISEEKFSWSLPEFRKKGFPDKTTVRYALESAKKIKYVSGRAGKDIGGSESEGWKLTPMGIEWMLKNEKRIASQIEHTMILSTVLPVHKAHRFIKNIKSKRLYLIFKEYATLESAAVYDFTDLLNCSPDSPNKVIKNQFALLKNNVVLVNNAELKNFLEACEHQFKHLLD